MSRRCPTPDILRIDLARALGFPDYPTDLTAEPYLNYISNRYIGRGTPEGYIKLLIVIIGYYGEDRDISPSKRSIQGLLDTLSTSIDDGYFADTKAGSQTRRGDVEDTVLYAIGTWALMLSSFVHLPIAGGFRKVTLAYNLRAQPSISRLGSQPYEESLPDLIRASGLLPTPGQYAPLEDTVLRGGTVQATIQLLASLNSTQLSPKTSPPSFAGSYRSSVAKAPQAHMSSGFLDSLDSLESLSIDTTRLNAYTLSVFGAVDVAWTHNISRHMLLSKRGVRHVLELFALPCALSATSLLSETTGISSVLAHEVRESYCSLFNAWPNTPRHAKLGGFLGVERLCWCWSCSAQQHRKKAITTYRRFSQRSTPGKTRFWEEYGSEYDPLLPELMQNEPGAWTPDLFPSLWTRIAILEEHLQAAKPWSIWVLFRDRRDTLQFWTFFFATLVVLLTVLQVLLSVAQVVGSFKR